MAKVTKKSGACPVCGTVYRHGSMADRCMRTKLCRHYNQPEGMRLRAYNLQKDVAAVIFFYVLPMRAQIKEEGLLEGLRRVEEIVSRVYAGLSRLQVNPRCGDDEQERIIRFCYAKLDDKKEFRPDAAVEMLKYLVVDMQEELAPFEADHPDMSLKDIWSDAVAVFDELLGDDVVSDDEGIREKERLIRNYLWRDAGPRKRLMRLFLVNDRFWVAGRTRNEIREVMRRELGLVKIVMEQVPLEERLEDGSRGSDLVARACGVPAMVGRCE